jgi:hypothetical protein
VVEKENTRFFRGCFSGERGTSSREKLFEKSFSLELSHQNSLLIILTESLPFTVRAFCHSAIVCVIPSRKGIPLYAEGAAAFGAMIFPRHAVEMGGQQDDPHKDSAYPPRHGKVSRLRGQSVKNPHDHFSFGS